MMLGEPAIGPGTPVAGSLSLALLVSALPAQDGTFILATTDPGTLRPPFAVLAETLHNQAVNFLTGAGGLLQQMVAR